MCFFKKDLFITYLLTNAIMTLPTRSCSACQHCVFCTVSYFGHCPQVPSSKYQPWEVPNYKPGDCVARLSD